MAEQALGLATVQVKADLDPLAKDLSNARTQVEGFTRTAAEAMGKVGDSTSKAADHQAEFNKTLNNSNVIYVDFNKKTDEQVKSVEELGKNLKTASQETQGFASRLADSAREGGHVVDVLKYGALGLITFSSKVREVTGISSILASLRTALVPVGLALLAVKIGADAFAGSLERVNELSKIQEDAFKAGVSAEFFQSQTKAAENLKIGLDSLTSASVKLTEMLIKPAAEGTGLDELLKKLTEANTIAGEASLKVIKGADTTEDKLLAIGDLISDMLQKGQRIAALELASKFFPPEIVRNLAVSSDYMQTIAKAIEDAKAAGTDIVSNQTVAFAKELQERLDVATKTLKQSFFDLTALGLGIRSVWVGIVEIAASLVTSIGNLLIHVGQVVQKIAEAKGFQGGTVQPSGLGVEGLYIPPEEIPSIDMGQRAGTFGAYNQFRSTFRAAGGGAGQQAQQQAIEMTRTQTLVWGDATNAAKKYQDALTGINDAMPLSKGEQLKKQLDELKEKYDAGVKALKLEAGPGEVDTDKLRQLTKAYEDTAAAMKRAAAESDAFNRALLQTARHIAQQEALASSVGKGAAAQAELRVRTDLTEVALREKLDPTSEAVARKIDALAARAGAAADKLARLRLQADAIFELAQLGRTEMEQSVASRLRVLGDDVNMKSALANQLMFVEQMKMAKDVTTSFATTFVSTFVGALQQGVGAWKAFEQAARNALNSVINILLDMITRQLVAKAFGQLLGAFGGFSGGFDPTHGVGGAGWNAPMSAGTFSAKGNVFGPQGVVPFARGGVVTGPTFFPFARGIGLMGEAGPEAVMPLARGPDGKLGIKSSSHMGGAVINQKIEIHNTSKDHDVTATSEEGPDGQTMLIEFVKKAHARGEFDNSNQSLYGLRRRKVR